MADRGGDELELVELDVLTMRDWVGLTGREPEPFGALAAGLEYRTKDRYAALRDRDGTIVAASGATLATVEVAGEAFEVVGFGGLIVRPDLRGNGVMKRVGDEIRRIADGWGPSLAMAFTRRELLSLHAARGYAPIEDPVWVDQPGGRIEMPEAAIWRPLHPGAQWPAGRVDVRGLPF